MEPYSPSQLTLALQRQPDRLSSKASRPAAFLPPQPFRVAKFHREGFHMTALNREFNQIARERGFTMVELMVVVAVMGVLAALAAPSFQPVIERWRVRSTADNIEHSMYYARSEAFKYGGGIVIARKTASGDCTSSGVTDWKCGWFVYRDINNNNAQDACVASDADNECTLRDVDGSASVKLTIPSNVGYFNIDRWGVISNNGATTGVSAEIVAKGRALTDSSSSKVCIPGTGGRIKTIAGSASC